MREPPFFFKSEISLEKGKQSVVEPEEVQLTEVHKHHLPITLPSPSPYPERELADLQCSHPVWAPLPCEIRTFCPFFLIIKGKKRNPTELRKGKCLPKRGEAKAGCFVLRPWDL